VDEKGEREAGSRTSWSLTMLPVRISGPFCSSSKGTSQFFFAQRTKLAERGNERCRER
jgi:hypothetical protein